MCPLQFSIFHSLHSLSPSLAFSLGPGTVADCDENTTTPPPCHSHPEVQPEDHTLPCPPYCKKHQHRPLFHLHSGRLRSLFKSANASGKRCFPPSSTIHQLSGKFKLTCIQPGKGGRKKPIVLAGASSSRPKKERSRRKKRRNHSKLAKETKSQLCPPFSANIGCQSR